jgi:hypothetical protein
MGLLLAYVGVGVGLGEGFEASNVCEAYLLSYTWDVVLKTLAMITS